ncbi:MAG: hypothetical protein CM1200mP9_08620 [Gammaproteobacteria bacterium]|nr:MAG: hypothetical protein CM1200mP9_08620 [Gammaproteobacteria bacterium]
MVQTGDLIRELTQEEVGFLRLVTRIINLLIGSATPSAGKSENVSTNEVGEIINGFDGIELSNVYGVEVPGADGRAGHGPRCASPDQVNDLDWDRFATYVNSELPAYARPVFVGIQNDMDVTGTFKMVKGDLRRESYDITAITDPALCPETRGESLRTA